MTRSTTGPHSGAPSKRSLRPRLLLGFILALSACLAAPALAAIKPAPKPTKVSNPSKVSKRAKVKVRPSYPVTVKIGASPAAGAAKIPFNYVGMSLEASQLESPELEPATGNLGVLMKSLAPGVVRFGGDSVENEWYADGFTTPPQWAVVQINDQNFQNLADLIAYTGWKVELTVEAVHDNAANAAAFVQAAYGYLGANLIGVEMGNESDVYIPTYSQYKTEFDEYAAAIHAVVPGMPILGPNSGNPSWLAQAAPYASASAPLTEHIYALSRCNGFVPQIHDLLSAATLAQETTFVENGLVPAQAAGVPLRVDESNSVACSGQDGVSNVLAASLWGTDYMLRLAQLGVAGINFHSGLGNCHGYTPLCQLLPGDHDQNIERARPLWYAMLLVHQLVGDTFLPVSATTPDGRLVSAYALIDGRGTYRLVIDDLDAAKGSPDAMVHVHLPKQLRSAKIERLVGPGVGASVGVTLGNGEVAKDGSFKTTGATEYAGGDKGSFTARVTPGSVALLTFSTKALPKHKVVKKALVKKAPAKTAALGTPPAVKP